MVFSDVITPGDCAHSYTITRTWAASDVCGNSTEATQIITVEDNTAPELFGVPADETASSGEVPNEPATGLPSFGL